MAKRSTIKEHGCINMLFIIVAGTSNGIGAAVAKDLAKQNFFVFIPDINLEAVLNVAKNLLENEIFHIADK